MNPSKSNIFQPAIDYIKAKYVALDLERSCTASTDPEAAEKARRLSSVFKSACSFLQVGNPPDYYTANVVYEYTNPHHEVRKTLLMALHCNPRDSMHEAEMVAHQFKKFGGKPLSLEITSISNIKFPMELAGGFGNAGL